MTASARAARGALTAWAAPWRARWQALAARERRLVALAAAVVAAFALWSVAVAPAWRTVRDAPAELERLERQWQEMQRLAAEARELRATPPLPPGQAAAALEASTQRLGTAARLVVAGDRATVTLNGVDGARLREWLNEVRSGARAQPVELQLTRGAQGYSGSVVLALPGSGT
jgi:general secretion pathway protein M